MEYILDWKKYSRIARTAAAEGCVLLKNDHDTLPLCPGDTVSVFGRIQLDYYKSGTGSGGMVNVPYVHSILDGLGQYPKLRVYQPLLETYKAWTSSHPFDRGAGWGTEPWSQAEMPLEDGLLADAAAHSDVALVILGRTAGEDRDNTPDPGSYYLTAGERDMLSKVCHAFRRTAVILNVGNIIDMSWVEEYCPGAVLYVWQGGMEGGYGAADVLCGSISPSGKLSDTIARSLADYPADQNFGSETENIYAEDIYVGYRYFETFARDRVLYPFGFGLSYTTFDVTASLQKFPETSDGHYDSTKRRANAFLENLQEVSVSTGCSDSTDNTAAESAFSRKSYVELSVSVQNTGFRPGKETVQVYVCPPQGLLGKPLRNLCGFRKTDLLAPGQTQTFTMQIGTDLLASYDDAGRTGNRSCFVLEPGEYRFYVGTDVRSAVFAGSFLLKELIVTQKCREAMAPTTEFQRLRPEFSKDFATPSSGDDTLITFQAEPKYDTRLFTTFQGKQKCNPTPDTSSGTSNQQPATMKALQPESEHGTETHTEISDPAAPATPAWEDVPLRRESPQARRQKHLPTCLPFTGDRGYRLSDVKKGRVSLPEFLAQLSDEDLMHLVRGEGMCSPKVTPGTAAAFGGITPRLQHFGIPAGCCSDGPSGIRMDCGTTAFSLPNGTLLACTFNPPLIKELFEMEGLELRSNRIDALLGPGINIHRHPLNGRNFEYHSEDPWLTGCMAIAQAEGMHQAGVSGTLKHFCANNQEYCRHTANGVISERALREIYLRPFELCVRSGYVRSIMTSYGPVNGIWTAGNYDLNTTLLREEWGFQGMVMTDWWARANEEGASPGNQNLAAMIRAQNDVYMVTPDAAAYQDNLPAALADGTLTRGELIRSGANICRFLLDTPALSILEDTFEEVCQKNRPDAPNETAAADMNYYEVETDAAIPLEEYKTDAGSAFVLALSFRREGDYTFALTAECNGSELAQMAVTLSLDGTVIGTYSFHGGSGPVTVSRDKDVRGVNHYLKFYFSQSGLKLRTLQILTV